MNYNPSPRDEILKSPESIKSHHVLVENEILRKHLSIALSEMQRQIANNAPADNMGACASAHLRMLGAQDFVQIFLNLAETPVRTDKADTTNLPGNTRKSVIPN